jgi:hypothetical protein
MREVIARVVDGSRFREFKKEYGQTIVTVSMFPVARIRVTKSYLGNALPGVRTRPRLPRGYRREQRHSVLAFGPQGDTLYPVMLAAPNPAALPR